MDKIKVPQLTRKERALEEVGKDSLAAALNWHKFGDTVADDDEPEAGEKDKEKPAKIKVTR